MATKLPSGNYRTQVLIDRENRKYKSFIGKTAREADMKAEQWKLQYLRTAETSLSFYNAAKKYLDASARLLSPYTLRGYTSTLKALRSSHMAFTRKNLCDISKEDLQRLYNAMTAAGKKPKTVKNCNGFISSVFAFHDIQMPKAKLPEVRMPDLYIPDEKALSRLVEAASGTRLYIPILLGMRGLRRGEICAIRASDLDGNILHIQRSMVWNGKKYVAKVPKTASSDRLVPLPDELAELIREKGFATDMTPHQLTQAFRKLVRRKSLGLKPFRFHDLRHAFVSIAHANGIPDAYVQAMGGWSTSRTLERVYRHSLDSYVAEYQDKMESVLRGVLRTPEN